jgi:CDP-paratose 2-epimerase
MGQGVVAVKRGHVVITGGAGFIGANLAARLLEAGERVVLLDDLSQPGSERNARWLATSFGGRVSVERADVREAAAVTAVVRDARQVFHLAASRSRRDPAADFEVVARGTLNVLEAVRASSMRPALVVASSRDVYGSMPHVAVERVGTRWLPWDMTLREHGVSELCRIDARGPFGCAMASADLYALDWARTFGVPAVVLRFGSVYGPRQYAGWALELCRRARYGWPVEVRGDGCQLRDLLYVGDAVDVLTGAAAHVAEVAGEAFNVGGGAANTLSVVELVQTIEAERVEYSPARPDEPRWYVSDSRKLERVLAWRPSVGIDAGLEKIHEWLGSADAAPIG